VPGAEIVLGQGSKVAGEKTRHNAHLGQEKR